MRAAARPDGVEEGEALVLGSHVEQQHADAAFGEEPRRFFAVSRLDLEAGRGKDFGGRLSDGLLSSTTSTKPQPPPGCLEWSLANMGPSSPGCGLRS